MASSSPAYTIDSVLFPRYRYSICWLVGVAVHLCPYSLVDAGSIRVNLR